MWKYVLAWIPMVIIAIGNGVIRNAWYENRVGELGAHQISTVTAVLLFGVYIWGVIRLWRPDSPEHALAIGLVWLALTVSFEFLFGRYVAKHSWRRLFHDYNVFAGRVWLVILIWITFAPYFFYRLQK